jgi:hypothetical protein
VTSWKHIKHSFEKVIGEGTVGGVNIVDRKTDSGFRYQIAFIRFRRWPETKRATDIWKRLNAGENINLVYDEGSPWFWRCTLVRD